MNTVEKLTKRNGPKSVLNVNVRDMVAMTAQIPDDSNLGILRPWINGFINEAKGGVTPERIDQIIEELMKNTATAGVASSLSASIKDSGSMAICLQHLLDFWSNQKNHTAEAATVKTTSSLSRNFTDDEKAIWDLINRS